MKKELVMILVDKLDKESMNFCDFCKNKNNCDESCVISNNSDFVNLIIDDNDVIDVLIKKL